jgi:hypothetical protein
MNAYELRLVNSIVVTIAAAVRAARMETDWRAFRRAVEAGDFNGAIDAVRLDVAEQRLQPLRTIMRSAFEESAAAQAKRINAPVRKAAGQAFYDVTNEASIRYVRDHGGELISEWGKASEAGLRVMLERALSGKITMETLTKRIMDSGIGITSRQANALENYRRGLEDSSEDYTSSQIERLVEKMYKRFLRDRANRIAQDEMVRAKRSGAQEMWRQARDRGDIDGSWVQMWVTTEEACDECDDLEEKTAELGEQFPEGGGFGPPLHPNCKCELVLVKRKSV